MLDDQWLDTVLVRLMLAFPNRFPPRGTPTDLTRAEWARELSGMTAEELKHGMANLPPDYPPTAAQFRIICQSRPKPQAPPEPAAAFVPDPDKVATAKSLVVAFDATQKGPRDQLRWARNLRKREANGDYLTLWQKQAWRDALAREMAAERLADEVNDAQG